MNVFEKIKEKLRKEKYKDREEIYTNAQCDAIRYSFGMAIDIVNQIAEEFATDTNVGNKDGWIPCSERLPKESGYYMGCIYNSEVDDFDFRKIWFAYVDDYDMEESEWRELYGFESVTAWQPLPEPYRQ